jgi:hypothetical protein
MVKKSPPKKVKDKSPPKPKLELTKTLDAFDRRNYDYYNSLPDELKKEYSPFILMRFMSSAPNQGSNHEYFLYAVNEIVNGEFWLLSKYPDLLHLLLCVCGQGNKVYHKWIPNKKVKKSKWLDVFKDKYKDLSELEIKILKKNYTEEEIYNLAMALGKTEKEANEYVKSFEEN